MNGDIDRAAAMQALAKQFDASADLQVRRAGQRISAIVDDLASELDPWKRAKPTYKKPLPVITEENRGHWDAARKREFRLQRCDACGFVRFPIAPVCPRCLSHKAEWALLSGRGLVSSWVVFHKAYWPGFRDDLPYVVLQVALEEGPRYISNLVGAKGQDIAIGMAVEAVYDDVTEAITLPKFRLVT
jgi:uncharacterized OB-fold protein